MAEHTSMRERALDLLRRAVGDARAQFRPGQWEAIHALAEGRDRLLVVERTGWGKSVVYFIATRLLRDRGAGCALLISPLLSLIRNQIAAAERTGVRAETINSTNSDQWPAVEAALRAGEIDILLVSPERLANEEFMTCCLLPLAARIGLFVVDEAHCISDWGHDFRPDYRRIVGILRALPPNLPVLATTATANDRVVNDVSAQLGPRLKVIRGSLLRESLRLENLRISSQSARLAWLADRIPKFTGSGIIYTLTVRDADNVATWLRQRGINARAYHAGLANEERLQLEDMLLANQVKALVATVALGMGFDKPDLGFVVLPAARVGGPLLSAGRPRRTCHRHGTWRSDVGSRGRRDRGVLHPHGISFNRGSRRRSRCARSRVGPLESCGFATRSQYSAGQTGQGFKVS